MEVKTPCADCNGLASESKIPPAHSRLVPWPQSPAGQAILVCVACGVLWRLSTKFGWSKVVA